MYRKLTIEFWNSYKNQKILPIAHTIRISIKKMHTFYWKLLVARCLLQTHLYHHELFISHSHISSAVQNNTMIKCQPLSLLISIFRALNLRLNCFPPTKGQNNKWKLATSSITTLINVTHITSSLNIREYIITIMSDGYIKKSSNPLLSALIN